MEIKKEVIMPSTVGSNKKSSKYETWEIDQKADTLIEAEKIKKDKPLFKLVMKELKKRKKALSELI
jgi:hypothetical protein